MNYFDAMKINDLERELTRLKDDYYWLESQKNDLERENLVLKKENDVLRFQINCLESELNLDYD